MFIIINSETLTAKDIETLKTLFAASAAPTAPAELTAENETNLDQLRQQMASAEPVALTPEPAEAPAQEPEKSKREPAKYPYRRPAGWEPDEEFYEAARKYSDGIWTMEQAARECNMTKHQFCDWRGKMGLRKKLNSAKSRRTDEIIASQDFRAIAIAWREKIYTVTEAAKKAGLSQTTFFDAAKAYFKEIAA